QGVRQLDAVQQGTMPGAEERARPVGPVDVQPESLLAADRADLPQTVVESQGRAARVGHKRHWSAIVRAYPAQARGDAVRDDPPLRIHVQRVDGRAPQTEDS